MFSYVAYGVGIRSVLALPELVRTEATDGAEDVVVRLGRVDRQPAAAPAGGGRARATRDEACLNWERAGGFLVRGGREIIVDPAQGVEERVLRLYLLGPVLAMLLYQQGRIVLHASAVAVGGGAATFLGGSGVGKSSVAAALNARGHPLISDGMTAVKTMPRSALVFPGIPEIKLWPDAASAIGMAPESLPRLHPDHDKRVRRIMGDFPRDPLPLRRIYVLCEAGQHEVERLRPQEALMELVRHCYGIRLLPPVIARDQFQRCGELANLVTACRLKAARSLAALPDLARVVEEDVSRDESAGSPEAGNPTSPGTLSSAPGGP